MQAKTLDQHIEMTPGISGGKPRIAGHRITVQNIAIWHDRMGKNADEISAEYDISLADIYAALAYYFDHRVEIDRSIEEGNAFAEELRQRSPSKVRQKLQERTRDGATPRDGDRRYDPWVDADLPVTGSRGHEAAR